MRWPTRWRRRDPGDAWGRLPVDLSVVRLLLDPRVAPYVAREAPLVAAAAARGTLLDGLHEAVALLRRVHGAWLGGGVRSRGGVAPREARAHLAGWRRPAVPRGAAGDGEVAMVVTLAVASHGQLLLGDVAVAAEDVRDALGALAGLLVADLLEVDLVTDGPLVRWADAARALPEPPLVVIAPPDPGLRFCPRCALPMPSEVDRCPSCAAALAA